MNNRVKIRELRQRAKAKGIRSISHLAELVPCSRQAIYFSLENPGRFKRVTRRVNQLTA